MKPAMHPQVLLYCL